MRVLKAAAKIIASIVLVAVVLLLILLAEPGWFLNTRTVSAALRRLGKSYRPTWSSLSFTADSPSLLDKRLVFDAEELCLDAGDGSFTGCFHRLRLDATVRLGFSPPVAVRRLETLIVHAGPLKADGTAGRGAGTKKRKATSGDLALVPRPLRSMTVGTVDVRVPEAEVISAGGATKLALSAAFSDKDREPLTARAFAVVRGTSAAVSRYRADLSLDTDLFRTGTVTYLDLRARAKGKDLDAELSATAREPRPGRLALSAKASARLAGRLLRARLQGGATVARASATASVSLEDLSGPVRLAALRDCRFDAPLGKNGPKSASLKCGIALQPRKFGGEPGAWPKQLTGALAVRADFQRQGLHPDHFTAAVDGELGPERKLYGFYARLRLELAGRTGSLPASLTAKHRLETGFTIRRFRDLVAALNGTELAIPAPLNALDGRASFSASTAGDARGESLAVDYAADTALSSAKQRLDVGVRGRLSIEDLFLPTRKASDETDVELKDVALQLPYLKLGPVPSPLVDRRIRTGDPKRDRAAEARRSPAGPAASTATAVAYVVRVATKKPVRLLTNLIKDPVPVALDLRAEPAGLTGRIEIEPFDLEAFRQTARVDHVTLTPRPGSQAMGLDGKLVCKRQDAVVNILLLGSTEKPQVNFESTPPMTQNEIVGLLLYGKTPAELDSDQQASAGAASSAFTDGAFGLASLYLFAATPVDSVGYDAATQSYEVKFKLPGGATLGVGSTLEESRTLTLRKRLLRNVEVETQLKQNEQQSGRSAVTTFLQWFRRW